MQRFMVAVGCYLVSSTIAGVLTFWSYLFLSGLISLDVSLNQRAKSSSLSVVTNFLQIRIIA